MKADARKDSFPFAHQPVLYQETLNALAAQRGGLYVDGTVGAGGHAWGLLQASAPNGRLLGLDVDPQALELAAHPQPGSMKVVVQPGSSWEGHS